MGGFLSSIRSAFSFIESAVSRGFESVAQTVQHLIGGGIEVSEAELTSELSAVESAKIGWNKIPLMPSFSKISEEFALPTNMDWREKHVMKMQIGFTNIRTGEQGLQWVTVESPNAMTKAEWVQQAKNAAYTGGWLYEYTIDFVSEWEYNIKTG